MKKIGYFLIFLFLSISPVYAGGLNAPQNVRVETAKCDFNEKNHYVQLAWDKVDNATMYEVYGKPTSTKANNYSYYGYTVEEKFGLTINKTDNYFFIVVAKSDGNDSPKSKEYFLNTPTVELACKTAQENKPWYEMKINSTIKDRYQLGDWLVANFSLSYFQPEKNFDDKMFVYKAFLYPVQNANIHYYEVTIIASSGRVVVYHLNDIPTGQYRLRIALDQKMTDMNGNSTFPFVDSSNEIYIYSNSINITPKLIEPSVIEKTPPASTPIYNSKTQNGKITVVPSPVKKATERISPVHDISPAIRPNGMEKKIEISNIRQIKKGTLSYEINNFKINVQIILSKVYRRLFQIDSNFN